MQRHLQDTNLVSLRVEVVVPGEDSDLGVALDERPQDISLGSKVEDGNVNVSVRVEGVGLLGRDSVDEVLLAGLPVVLSLRRGLGNLLLSDGDPAEGRSLVSKKGRDGSGVDTRDSRDVVSLAPLVKGLDGEVVRVLERDVSHDDTGALDTVRLHLRDSRDGIERLVGGDTIVANEGRGEDEDLTKVRGVGHGLGVCTAKMI